MDWGLWQAPEPRPISQYWLRPTCADLGHNWQHGMLHTGRVHYRRSIPLARGVDSPGIQPCSQPLYPSTQAVCLGASNLATDCVCPCMSAHTWLLVDRCLLRLAYTAHPPRVPRGCLLATAGVLVCQCVTPGLSAALSRSVLGPVPVGRGQGGLPAHAAGMLRLAQQRCFAACAVAGTQRRPPLSS